MSCRVVLNIGWARAASTAFRQNFLTRHPDIVAVDRGQSILEGPAAAMLLHLKAADDARFRRYSAALCSEWESFEQQIAQPVLCLTDEELSIGLRSTGIDPRMIAKRCGSLFPEARTLAIVRDQVDAIRSFYALAERQGGTEGLSLSDWTRRFFLAPEGRGFSHLFDYMATLQAYLEWQPRHDVIVLPYDRLRNNHAAFYAEVADALGISEQPCEQLPNEIVNASPSALLATPLLSDRRGAVAGGYRVPAEYSPGLEDEIRTLYESCNRELAREFRIEFSATNAIPGRLPQVQGA